MLPIRVVVVLVPIALFAALGQTQPQSNSSTSRLEVTSRAVIVDVVVTDSSGKPVTGLAKDAFTLKEQGKAQAISFFEEHSAASRSPAVEIPKLPLDVFTNFSPYPEPAAVNVILFDSLNTYMGDQSYAHAQAMKFLNTAKPGARSAIFAMGLTLRFIQGFSDDPAVLAAALKNKKNIEVGPSPMLTTQAEADALASLPAVMSAGRASQDSINSMKAFLQENTGARAIDRMRITLGNLQRLAVFLQGFPGRKNIIWFSERVPTVFLIENNELYMGDPVIEDEIKKTLAMLGAARAALYPVDPHGLWGPGSAEAVRTSGETLRQITADQISAQLLAEQSGGRAFANTNGLSEVLDKITAESGHFYTLSYSPVSAKMDGSFRKIELKVPGSKYKLLYRSGYYAVDTDRLGSLLTAQYEKAQNLPAPNPEVLDPLLPFMQLGMPQSQEIVYKIKVLPRNATTGTKDDKLYRIDFDIDLKDLDISLGADGVHNAALSMSVIVYDRYGNVISRQGRPVDLTIKPNEYAELQDLSVQLHAKVAVPRGNYWLRTGIYDRASGKLGTMEIPLSAVKPLQTGAE